VEIGRCFKQDLLLYNATSSTAPRKDTNMKMILTVLACTLLGLGSGCITSESESLPDESVGQVEQDLRWDWEPPEPPPSTCDCALGTYWNGSNCSSFVVGPTPPNACFADCQCPSNRCSGWGGVCF
jgi:hypothetical protein